MGPWGKASRNNSKDRHHLAHHCADVAAVFLALSTLPVIRSRFEYFIHKPLNTCQLERLASIVFLHDMGKLNTGFQSKIWAEDMRPAIRAGHVQEGMDLLNRNFRRIEIPSFLRINEIYGWGPEAAIGGYFRASISHHGVPADPGSSRVTPWSPHNGYDPAHAANQIGAAMQCWFPTAFSKVEANLPENERFLHFFAGLVSLADWIGSDQDFFPYAKDFRPDYINQAKQQAANAVAAFGLDTTKLRSFYEAPASFKTLTTFDTPNPAQAATEDIATDEQLVILESETGSGKTEAALLRFLRLWEAGHVDSLFFALPTRSAAVQLCDRVQKALKRVFKEYAPDVILAVPGYLQAGMTGGRRLPGYQVLWDDDKTNTPERIARRWAAENSKRYLAAEIAVGTVDQAMLASLPVKHAHLRAASLARSLLVIDEVHASDRFMTAIQSNLLNIHLGAGGYAMLMSATLGERARCGWLSTPPKTLKQAESAPYPVIWTGNGEVIPAAETRSHSKNVSMTPCATENPEDCLDELCAAAYAGAKVLVIRNTVSHAVATLRALEDRIEDSSLLLNINGLPTLHHGRFAPADRRRLDGAVEHALGRNRDGGGRIVIGTQTLEQSLDIDADFLVTDLCPADVLLQRLGRLYRHGQRTGRTTQEPRCTVLVPKVGLDACLNGGEYQMVNGLGGFVKDGVLSGIYVDLVTVEATRRLIHEHPVWSIPDMNRLLVENTTHPEAHAAILETLPPEWTDYAHDVLARNIAETQQAHLIRLDPEIPYDDLKFPSDEERIRTRLGGAGITVEFPEPPPGPFGEPVECLTLSEHWSRGMDPMTTPYVVSSENGVLTFRFSDRLFRYDRHGLERMKNSEI